MHWREHNFFFCKKLYFKETQKLETGEFWSRENHGFLEVKKKRSLEEMNSR